MPSGLAAWHSRPAAFPASSTPRPAARSRACCNAPGMATIDFSLYLVTDRRQTRGRLLPEVIHAALRAGVRAIQLREKDLPTRPLLALARELTDLANQYGGRMLVNDRVDVSLAAGSGGVHLPAAGLPVSAVRVLMVPHRLIGVSTHSAEAAARAESEG